MSFEGKPEQSNKEKFKSEFEVSLSKYFLAADALHNCIYLGDGEFMYSNEEVEQLKLDERKGMEEMIELTIKGFKIYDNKQEMIDIIKEMFSRVHSVVNYDYDSPQFSNSDARLQFFERLILKVMKE